MDYAQLFAGVDLYSQSSAWVHVAILVGLAGMAATVWLANRLADRPSRSPWLQRMMDDAAGRSLSRAARELGEIEAFERE